MRANYDLANSQQRGHTNFFGELCSYARHVLDTERGHGKIGDVNICSTHITLTFLLPDPRIAPLDHSRLSPCHIGITQLQYYATCLASSFPPDHRVSGVCSELCVYSLSYSSFLLLFTDLFAMSLYLFLRCEQRPSWVAVVLPLRDLSSWWALVTQYAGAASRKRERDDEAASLHMHDSV